MPKIFFGYADIDEIINSSYWRCFVPFNALKAAGHDVALDAVTKIQLYKDYDVFIFERNLLGPFLPVLRQLKSDGKLVYATLDDCYDLLPAHIPTNKIWLQPGVIDDLHKIMGEIDGTIMPSRELAKYYSQFGLVSVVENYFPDAWLDIPCLASKFDLGWSGSSTHSHAWKQSKLKSALKNSKYSLFLNCYDMRILTDLHGMYSGFKSWKYQEEYPQIADLFRVGLAPLAGEYDRFRSNIKVMLYALRGKPWVASSAPPYANAKGGTLIDNKKGNWLDAIENSFANYEKLSAEGQEWASTYAISKHLTEYTDLWE